MLLFDSTLTNMLEKDDIIFNTFSFIALMEDSY